MLLDAATLRRSSEMHPAIREFLAANPIPELDWSNAASVHATVEFIGKMMAEQIGAPEPAITEEHRSITMRDGFSSLVKIVRPTAPPPAGSPLIVHFFGGGFIAGNADTGTVFARAWTRLFGATVVCASYRLAPEHKFPVSQNDSWDTVKWLDGHAEELGADLSKGFVVSGISAGGAIAACVTAHALEGGEDKLVHTITGQHLCVPSVMDKEHVPEKYREYFVSQEQNKDAPILPYSAFQALKGHASWDDRSPWRWAVLSKAPLEEFPPTYFQVCGMDTIRDDGLIYEEILKEAGVKTKIDLYEGCPHAHFSLYPNIEPTNRALADMVTGVGWLLGKNVTAEQGLGAYLKPS